MSSCEKEIAWAPGTREALQTPPLSAVARRDMGYLLGQVQNGEYPERTVCDNFKPASEIGSGCYQISYDDKEKSKSWRIIYWVTKETIFILDVYEKRSQERPRVVKERCKTRLKKIKEIMKRNGS